MGDIALYPMIYRIIQLSAVIGEVGRKCEHFSDH